MASGTGTRPGDFLAGRYRIERKLGEGGMAVVYLVHDTKYDRQVALKLLRREIALLLGGDRFLREIEVVARLNHPNILPLHDSDQVAERLFFLMPYVEGGSLRDRLAREPRLTVDQAVDFTRQVAAGLAYAHQMGVIHRDIKPANLLLSGNHVFIADFGIARAVRQAATKDSLTEAGHRLGTPDYMAPEQFHGASQVDGRADEYSLACVLFEMLTGRPPGPDSYKPGVVKTALNAADREVPPALERALSRALALDPDQRFATAAEFAAELEAPGPGFVREIARAFRRAGRRAVIGTAVVALAIAGLLWWPRPGSDGRVNQTAAADTTRFAILPFEYESGVAPGLGEEQGLRAALRRWLGVEPVDPVRVREAVARRGGGRLTSEDAVAISRAVEAGRYLRGSVSRVGDSLRISGTLYGVGGSADSLLAEHTVSLVPDPVRVEAALAELVDHLLLRRAPPAGGFGALGTHSLPAWQAFNGGQQAIREWRLAAADSAFAGAAGQDPDFARAHLWLGLARWWSEAEPAQWRYAAEQAAAGRESLTPQERPMSEGLLAVARDEPERACRIWQASTRTSPEDFAVWYSWAHCQRTDDAVVRDPRRPSGWQFRSSYSSALRAYQRAFQLRPAVLSSFRGGSFESIRHLLKTSGSDLRSGTALPPDSGSFVAYPGWEGDTLAFVPYPIRDLLAFRPGVRPASSGRAVSQQRRLFHEIALTWATAAPDNADALEALGIALEMLGDPSALDTLRRARGLARDGPARLRVAGAEVWAGVRFSIPGSLDGLRSARSLADSLLREFPVGTAPEPGLLSSLAALTGRAGLAAAHARRAAAGRSRTMPLPLLDIAPALLTFASLGGPRDSLQAFEPRVLAAIERDLPESERAAAMHQWLGRAASLAFSDWRFPSLSKLSGQGYLLVDAQVAFARGELDSARLILARLHQVRQGLPPATLTLDALYPEARLLLQMGDTAEAAGWMAPTLAALRLTAPEVLADPWRAASLVRAIALQAELARAGGDPRLAALWAGCAVILWSDADAFLQPLVRQLQQLAG